MSDGRGHNKVSVAVRPAAGADAAVEHGMNFHRFDEEAAYRSTFKGVVWMDNRPYMDGPVGRIAVTIRAVERYRREYNDAYGQGYHHLDLVLENITETAYWDAVKYVKTLKEEGHADLLPDD